VGKTGAHRALQAMLRDRLEASDSLPDSFRSALGQALDRAVALAERVVGQETLARQAATALYDASSAVLLAWEGSRPGADARRALVARFVLAHRLSVADPLAPQEAAWEQAATDALLGDKALGLEEVVSLLG